jgi:hypothetical protein
MYLLVSFSSAFRVRASLGISSRAAYAMSFRGIRPMPVHSFRFEYRMCFVNFSVPPSRRCLAALFCTPSELIVPTSIYSDSPLVEPFGLLPSLDTATQRRDSESPHGLSSVATYCRNFARLASLETSASWRDSASPSAGVPLWPGSLVCSGSYSLYIECVGLFSLLRPPKLLVRPLIAMLMPVARSKADRLFLFRGVKNACMGQSHIGFLKRYKNWSV